MKSSFHRRTPYPYISAEVPSFFLELDDHFDKLYTDPNIMFRDKGPTLAENTCRRMADIELFSEMVSDHLVDHNPFMAATLVSSFLTGFFSACKSLFDAISIGLSEIYQLPLSSKEKDFLKQKFWTELSQAEPTVNSRYLPFKDLAFEVRDWRDSFIHRFSPLVVAHAAERPDLVPRENVEIRMIGEPNGDMRAFLENHENANWMHPLDLYNKWRGDFLNICSEFCTDIKSIKRTGPA